MTAAQFEDQEGRDLVEAIHARKAEQVRELEQRPDGTWYAPEDGVYRITIPTDWTPTPIVCRHCRTVHVATTTAAPFDYDAPLPPMPDYRSRSWEPAARHYRDIDESEKESQ